MAGTIATVINKKTIQASETWDPPNIVAGSSAQFTMTGVTGAVAGDLATVSFSIPLGGLGFLLPEVGTDQVIVTLANSTAGAVNLGLGTLTVRVEKK